LILEPARRANEAREAAAAAGVGCVDGVDSPVAVVELGASPLAGLSFVAAKAERASEGGAVYGRY
jgi:hypothetical protein